MALPWNEVGAAIFIPSCLYGLNLFYNFVFWSRSSFFLKLNFSLKVAPRPKQDRTNNMWRRDESRDAGSSGRWDWSRQNPRVSQPRARKLGSSFWRGEIRRKIFFSTKGCEILIPRRDPLGSKKSLQIINHRTYLNLRF